jgi:tetratricopeptide (TPR) repeat protein
MADSGALSMAYTLVALTRKVTEDACERERGLLAADQAMIARLIGDLDAAEELYRVAEAIGEKAADMTLLSRSFIGRGVIDRVRGNYPRSRIFFERALELAETVQARDLLRLAHQGLTVCHTVAENYDRGLQHGWATFQLADGDSAREVEALANLAHICLVAGFPAAALRGYAAMLDKVVSPRVILGALGGAAVAAAQAGEASVLARAAGEIDTRVGTSGLPYENAQSLYSLATAYATIGDVERRDAYLARSRKIAKARGFFELLHKTDPAELERAAQRPPASVQLTRSSQTVVTSLTEFDVGEAGALLSLTRRA